MDPLPLTPAQAAKASDTAAAPHRAAIALGANLGDRAAAIASAIAAIARLPDTRITAQSSIIETAAVTLPGSTASQSPYLNAAITIATTLLPRQLLESLLEIERAHGRARNPLERWGPRTLDLDLLLYDDLTLHEPGLDLPHPRLHERAFVLIPLAEIAADWRVPGIGKPVRALHADLPPRA